MNAAFNMRTEIANLAERIVGPVAARLAQKELDTVVGQIRHSFEHLSIERAPGNVDFEDIAANILEPVRAEVGEATFVRIVDRLRGAMVGFCQCEETKVQPDTEPWSRQQAGERETPHVQQNEQSEPTNAEPWWINSEQAMAALILLWLCTGIDWQLH
jgi:hypothetical protein